MVAAALRFLRADEYRETRLDVALPALAIAAFLVAWYLAVALFRVPAYSSTCRLLTRRDNLLNRAVRDVHR